MVINHAGSGASPRLAASSGTVLWLRSLWRLGTRQARAGSARNGVLYWPAWCALCVLMGARGLLPPAHTRTHCRGASSSTVPVSVSKKQKKAPTDKNGWGNWSS